MLFELLYDHAALFVFLFWLAGWILVSKVIAYAATKMGKSGKNFFWMSFFFTPFFALFVLFSAWVNKKINWYYITSARRWAMRKDSVGVAKDVADKKNNGVWS